MKAACTVKRRGYKTRYLDKYIPKKQAGQIRALPIPTMRCGAQQALYLLALELVVELKVLIKMPMISRLLRSSVGTMEQCFKDPSQKNFSTLCFRGKYLNLF